MDIENTIILGTGCAGLTAAIYAARANLTPLVIDGQQPGGQLTTTSEVENYPGFAEGIDGFELTQHMRKQAQRFGARYESDTITAVTLEGDLKVLHSKQGKTYKAKSLIIATGASPRLLNIPGEQTFYGGKGVTTCATCDGAFYKDQDVVVIGGGDSACEEALFLTRFCRKITLIHRRDTLRASKIMAERVLAHEKIEVLWNKRPLAILGEERVHSIELEDTQTQKKLTHPCTGVFLAIGHIPNTAPFKDLLKTDDLGYLLPEGNSQVRTHIPGIFLAGDCSDHVYRQAITAAGMGCQAAISAERYLADLG